MPSSGIHHQSRAADCAALDANAVISLLASSAGGLSSPDAAARLAIHGPNVIGNQGHPPRLAWLSSHFQTGLANLLDRAILDHEQFREQVPHAGYRKCDDVPFDFERRMMSVVVDTPNGTRQLICKGAPEAIYERCRWFESEGRYEPLAGDRRGSRRPTSEG